MSGYQGSGGLSRTARGIPPHGLRTNGIRPSRSKYKNHRPSDQKNTSGQRRKRRQDVVRAWMKRAETIGQDEQILAQQLKGETHAGKD